MFLICGAFGVLSTTPGGPPVKDDAGFVDILQSYYYTPRTAEGENIFFMT
jgi:hypothetical protein